MITRILSGVDLSFTPLGRSIGRAHKFLRAWGDRELAPHDASVTDFILLFHISMAPPPGRSQTEIARYSDMGGPALVRHVDRIEPTATSSAVGTTPIGASSGSPSPRRPGAA